MHVSNGFANVVIIVDRPTRMVYFLPCIEEVRIRAFDNSYFTWCLQIT
jgi:hypothetical protein